MLQQALSGFAGRWDTCVLRTEQPRNLPFYARNGFELRDELVIPQSGLRTWFFSRAV